MKYLVPNIAFFTGVLLVVVIYGTTGLKQVNGIQEPVLFPKASTTRMQLTYSTTEDYGSNEVGATATCSEDSILVNQGASSPLPNGIPTYTVDIENVCVFGNCSISDIHLSCEWFSSARLIDPKIFRRIGYNDCLVNDGQPLNPGESLSFQYANTFKYPLLVSSVAC